MGALLWDIIALLGSERRFPQIFGSLMNSLITLGEGGSCAQLQLGRKNQRCVL